ncbi:MAG: substrate-binding domain-containing protein [Lachnospiraceae bacterium]|nr:substrate-binding domain-containing protein [Lachnospiraceae bacterium]
MNDERTIRKYYRMIMILIYIVLFAIIAFFLVRRVDLSAEQKENSRRIGVSYMTMNNEFFRIINEQIRLRVEAEGDIIYIRDPALDAERQKSQIEDLLDLGVTALVITPVDLDGLDDVIKKAKDMGVYVVVVDSDVGSGSLVDCSIVSDNYNAGCLDAQYMMESQESGDIVVFTHDRAVSGRQRVQGFLDTIEGNSAFNVRGTVECEGQYEIALPKMREFINSGEKFDTVFCLNDPAAMGVVAALQEKGIEKRVSVYGVDASPDAKALIDSGLMSASAVQFPTKIGETAAEVLYQLINGESVEKRIIVPVDIVTRDNIGEYDKERWQ